MIRRLGLSSINLAKAQGSNRAPAYIYTLANDIYISRRDCRFDHTTLKVNKPLRPKLKNIIPTTPEVDEKELELIEDLPFKINTDLTEEQKAHVAAMKKRMKGARAAHSMHRDVPYPEEIQPVAGFAPWIPSNADQLIDWAIAHIPLKAGPRRSRHRKRIAIRQQVQRYNNHLRREGHKLKNQRRKVRVVSALCVKVVMISCVVVRRGR